MLVTPFRDGMNLVAKEYVAAHIDGDGVLVLSEFAGAADELTDAVLVNPHDDRALQRAIVTAVEMNRHERRERMAGLRAQIRKRDVRGWANDFMDELRRSSTPNTHSATSIGRAATTTRRLSRNSSPARHDRCSSASTSTACWRRSSATPTTPR